jgi:hypothetical protein
MKVSVPLGTMIQMPRVNRTDGPRWAALAAVLRWMAWAGGRIQKHGPASSGVGVQGRTVPGHELRFTWPDGDNGDIGKWFRGCDEGSDGVRIIWGKRGQPARVSSLTVLARNERGRQLRRPYGSKVSAITRKR